MSRLQREDHEGNGVACPPRPSEIGRRKRQPLQLGHGASQLPQANSQPEVTGGETGPRKGALTRLEPDEGKLSSPVLRGGSGSNAASLPDLCN